MAGFLTWAPVSQAADVFRLALPAQADVPAMKLGDASADAETLDVWGRRCWGGGGFFGGGFRGSCFRGGYYGGGGYCGSYYGGACYSFRPSYCYRPAVSYSYSYSCYPQPYYYGYSYGCYPGYCYAPIADTVPGVTANFSLKLGNPLNQPQPAITNPGPATMPPAATLPAPSVRQYPSTPSQPSLPRPADGTFDYDGGPKAPVPMPQTQPAPPMNTQPSVPLEGRPVSLQVRSTAPRYTYPAYGEVPRVPAPSQERTLPVRDNTVRQVQR